MFDNFKTPTRELGIRKVFEPHGACIYCGARDVKLTDEHTLPDGLGGRHILPKASCVTCQRVIAPVEQYCMRTLLGNLRAHSRIRSSKKRPPVRQSVLVLREEGGQPERVHADIDDLPLLVGLPVFPAPTVVLDEAPPAKFWGQHWTPMLPTKEMLDKLGAFSFVSEEISPLKLARMIAKIAHSYAVSNMGADAFRHRLPPIILGQQNRFIEYVGGMPEIPPPSTDVHTIDLNVLVRDIDHKIFVATQIRLFGNIGAPVYFVVVGELAISLDELNRRYLSQAP